MPAILQYEGRSNISKAISFLTWNRTTHTAYELDDGRVIEAWGGDNINAVRITANYAHAHTPGTTVRVYNMPTLTKEQQATIETYLFSQLGTPYNWRGCLRFLTRRDPQAYHPLSFNIRQYAPSRWFCSCLIYTACLRAGFPLLCRIPPWRVSPGLINLSSQLTLTETRTVPEP